MEPKKRSRALTVESAQRFIRRLAKEPLLLEAAVAGLPESSRDGERALFVIGKIMQAACAARQAQACEAAVAYAKLLGAGKADFEV